MGRKAMTIIMLKNFIRLTSALLSFAILFAVPPVYAMEKNVRPAGIVDYFDSFEFMDAHDNVKLIRKKDSNVLIASNENNGSVLYRSYEPVTQFRVYYSGEKGKITAAISTDGFKYKAVNVKDENGCVSASDIKGKHFYLKITVPQGVELTVAEVNTTVKKGGLSGNVIIDEFSDFSKMYSHDDGFATNTDKPEEHGGDATRIVRGAAADGASIIYQTPEDISAIKLKNFYGSARSAGTEAKLTFFLSKDGNKWEEITPNTVGLSGSGLGQEAKEMLSGIPSGMRYFKIQFGVAANTVDWSPKLGRLELYYGPLVSPVVSFASSGASGAAGSADAGMETVNVPSSKEVVEIFKNRNMAGVHPRLLADADDFERIRSGLGEEPYSRWFESLKAKSDQYFAENYVEFVDTDVEQTKKDFLHPIREFKARLENLSMMWKLTGEARYAQRAYDEMENAMNFPTLYPEHYLNVGEGVFAFAVAYDWLYDWMSEEQRTFAEKGIRKQLDTGHTYMMEGSYFTRNTNNWNGVCCGGLAVAALAIMETDYEYCADFVSAAVKHTPKSIVEMAPAGVYPEGPGYWDFGTEYLVYMMSAMDYVLGDDFGLSQIDGFEEAGDFLLFISSPIRGTFNFADSGEGAYDGPQAYWFAKKFNKPICSWYQYNIRPAGGTWDLIYYDPKYYTTPETINYPLDQYREGAENFSIFRSSFDDASGTYAALKGGDNQSSHGDLDIGTFLFDALGQRWACELGAENYAVDGYWDLTANGGRWNYYSKRAEGHNTLVINPGMKPDQDPMAADEITDFKSVKGGGYTILDMSNAYAEDATSVRRGMMVFDAKQQMMIQDEVECIAPSEIYWSMHTSASIEVAEDGKSAILTRNGEKCLATLQTPAEARLEVREAKPLAGTPNPPGNASHKGLSVLSVHLTDTKNAQIRVILTPLYTGEVDPNRMIPDVKRLDEWTIEDMEKAELSSLSVDGKPIENFTPSTYLYTVQVPEWVSEPIEVKAESKTGIVEIVPQDSVLGQTVIRVKSEKGNVSPATYAVRFTEMPVTDVPEGTPAFLPVGVLASDVPEPANVPENTLDGSLDTRWAAEGDQWIRYDLGEKRALGAMGLSFMNGDQRVNYFSIDVSDDDKNWTTVWEGESSGTTAGLVTYIFNRPVEGRYIRFFGHGTSSGAWNSVTEARIYGAVERKKTFTDIVQAWGKQEIEDLFTEEIVDGATTLYFEPETPILTKDFIRWTARLCHVEPDRLKAENYAGELTRQHAASILARAAEILGLNLVSGSIDNFADKSEIDAKYVLSVQLMVGSGILKGTAQDTFSPSESLTREQAAIILHRLNSLR